MAYLHARSTFPPLTDKAIPFGPIFTDPYASRPLSPHPEYVCDPNDITSNAEPPLPFFSIWKDDEAEAARFNYTVTGREVIEWGFYLGDVTQPLYLSEEDRFFYDYCACQADADEQRKYEWTVAGGGDEVYVGTSRLMRNVTVIPDANLVNARIVARYIDKRRQRARLFVRPLGIKQTFVRGAKLIIPSRHVEFIF